MPGLPTTASVIPRSTWGHVHGLWYGHGEPEGAPWTREAIPLRFVRAALIPYYRELAAKVVPAFGLQPTQRVVVLGGLFGWLAEAFRDVHGWADPNLLTLDPSPYIQGAYNTTEEADINAAVQDCRVWQTDAWGNPAFGVEAHRLRVHDGDGYVWKERVFDGGVRTRVRFSKERLATTQSVNAVRQMFSGNAVDAVLTCDGYLNYHNDPEIADIIAACTSLAAPKVGHIVYQNWGNQKPLAAWKALRPEHKFMDYFTAEVV